MLFFLSTLLLLQQPDSLEAARVQARREVAEASASIKGESLRQEGDVADAIRSFSGLQLKDYGGLGGLKTINLRSLSSAHTGVYLDGIPIDNAQNGQVDLGRLSTEGLESISLYQGQRTSQLQGAREYGSANALYLQSAVPERSELSFRLRGGSFGALNPSLQAHWKISDLLAARLQLRALRSDGQYPFHVADFRILPDGSIRGYDSLMFRQNCDIKAFGGAAQLFVRPSGGQYQAQVQYYDSERGIPGPVYKQADTYPLSLDRQADRNLLVQAGGQQQISPSLGLMLRARYSSDILHYLDVGELDPAVSAAWDYELRSVYASTALSWNLCSFLELGAAADFQGEWLHSMTDHSRRSLYTAVSTRWTLPGKVLANLSLQYLLSDGAGHFGFLSPALVVSWDPSPEWSFGGFLKRSCRLPSFNELYYTNASERDVLPEDVWQLCTDWAWKAKRGKWSWSAREELYLNYVNNKLVCVPNGSLFRWSVYNLGAVRIIGDEISASLGWDNGRLSAGGTARYIFQWAKDRDTGLQVPYIPLHSASFDLYAGIGIFRLDVQGFLSGTRYSALSQRREYVMAPWTVWDVKLSCRPVRDLNLGIRIRNIGDSRYELIKQYPLPGVHVMASAEWTFGIF